MRSLANARRPWIALRNPNFRLYFGGQIVSLSGTWMQRIGQSWLVLDLDPSPLALGTLTVLQFAPILLLSLFAGSIVDRFSKRWLVFVLQAAALVQATALAALVLTHTVQIWHVYVLAAMLGTISAFDSPARQTFVSELVPREEIQSAVGLNASAFNVARIFGPGVGGLIIAAAGVGWCFAINAASYVAVLVALAAMRGDALLPGERSRGRVLGDIAGGLRYVVREPEIGGPLLLAVFVGTFGYNFSVALPLLARYTFGAGAAGFGLLNAAQGVGSLVGALIVASRTTPTVETLVVAASVFAVLLIALGASPAFIVAALVLVFVGIAGVNATTGTNALLQLRSEPAYRGRVLSLYFIAFAGTTPFGGAFTGAIANEWNVRVALFVNAALVVVGAALALLYVRRRRPLAAAVGDRAGRG
ncbi:MAG TPA: MFS transporter [Candidatus Limnocylindria bacterium]